MRFYSYVAFVCLVGGCGSDGEPSPPVDGPIVESESLIPPLEGGSLDTSGKWLVASDAQRQRVNFVDTESMQVTQSFEFDDASIPGRTFIRGEQALVSMGEKGSVVRFELDEGGTWQKGTEFSLCDRVEGLDVDPDANMGWVVCLEGVLLSFNIESGTVLDRFEMESDLRDVVVDGENIFVSVFRTAKVIVLTKSGELVREVYPLVRDKTQPTVAWRMRQHPRGGVLLVHQIAAHGAPERPIRVDGQSNSYGATGSCRVAIMSTGVSHIRADGALRGGRSIGDIVLPLDAAISNDRLNPELTIIGAGNKNNMDPGPPSILRARETDFLASDARTTPVCIPSGLRHVDGRKVLSVEYLDDGRLAYQSYDPSMVTIDSTSIELPGEPIKDTGHVLFHTDAGGGIACASCHPLGRDDGITWFFASSDFSGPRRTPLVSGGISTTPPFHWSGDVADYGDLMHQIFSLRMGGQDLGDRYADALGGYVDRMLVPEVRIHDPDAVERGRVLFNSSETECADCHRGPSFTDNLTRDVGTGELLQVPRLLGLRWRAPYMHDGCAKTLRERFTTDCGGTDHGEWEHLSPAELDDLIAFLNSI